ncbi:hypothetical protein FRC10_010964 [Ceratobasidium sp. 414]|nr:hypothetical protein FRC10_010964 [Ceratobasidium sp. 414]
MSRRRSNLFMHVKSAPNPDAKFVRHPASRPALWEHRLRQSRPISRNPFVADDSSSGSYEGTGVESPGPTMQPVKFDSSASGENSQEELRIDNTNHDIEWGEHAPEWLNLFDVEQQVQAALGFDVSTYILHSPGSTQWEDTAIETITPDQYSNERVAKVSLVAISIVLALSRLLLLVQHIRVAIYAKFTHRSKRYPKRLLLVPAAMAISTALFFVAFVITKRHGEEVTGAKVKFFLWAPAIVLEVVAHVVRFQWDINDGIRLRSHGSITGRLSGITTIILGEASMGINAIAGTFYAIEKAPGFGGPTGAGIICCAIIVFFLTYLYFEGAAPLKSVRRRAAWVMAHLPWLLSAILLLEGKLSLGVKNQLLLSSFLNSASYLIEATTSVIYPDGDFDPVAFNNTMRPLMLKAGMTFDSQWAKLVDLISQNMTATNVTDLDDQTLAEIQGVWYYRLEMMSILNTYINFMDNETITDSVQQNINKYQNDYAYVYQANRFHWASIISRYTMGFSMALLVLMNVGKYQTFFQPAGVPDKDRAAIFNWIDAVPTTKNSNWVLPTIALAYGVQFLVDTALVYAAIWFGRKAHPSAAEKDR